jgi:hypothetical protein
MPKTLPEFEKVFDVFREDVIRYLVKLQVEVDAIHLALHSTVDHEPVVNKDQMNGFRLRAGGTSDQVGNSIRQEFGLPTRPSRVP